MFYLKKKPYYEGDIRDNPIDDTLKHIYDDDKLNLN